MSDWTVETLEAARRQFVEEISAEYSEGFRTLWVAYEPHRFVCCERCDPDTDFWSFGIARSGESGFVKGAFFTPETPPPANSSRECAWCLGGQVETSEDWEEDKKEWDPRTVCVPPTVQGLEREAWEESVLYLETRRWSKREQEEEDQLKIRYLHMCD